MSYIVPKDIPKSCSKCPFSALKYSHPFWSDDTPNTKGYICQASSDRFSVDMAFDDETTKDSRCPLREVQYGEWKQITNGYICSNCGKARKFDTPYCSSCGTKMKI